VSSVTAFVDDVVQGHLPYVCAKTGAPADGIERIEKQIGSSWPAGILIFFGPVGWIVLIALSSMSKTLTVRIPMSFAAINHERVLRRVRMIAAFATLAAVIGGAMVHQHLLRPTLFVVSGVAFAITVVFHFRIQFALVDVDLDASGRWVTLRGVHRNFADAVAVRTAAARADARA
jgi:hypothetical protein